MSLVSGVRRLLGPEKRVDRAELNIASALSKSNCPLAKDRKAACWSLGMPSQIAMSEETCAEGVRSPASIFCTSTEEHARRSARSSCVSRLDLRRCLSQAPNRAWASCSILSLVFLCQTLIETGHLEQKIRHNDKARLSIA